MMSNSQMHSFEPRHHSVPEEFHILKTTPQSEVADLLFITSQSCQVPAAVLLVVENGQSWIKASHGISEESVPSDDAFWKIPLDQKELVVVDNLSEDSRFVQQEFTFFAGAPLITATGQPLGVLVILDTEKRSLGELQRKSLQILSYQVLSLVTFQKQNNEYLRVQHNLEQKYRDLEKFASVVSHDIKSPLANIISLTELLKEENQHNFNEETRQYIEFLSQASHSLRSYVDGLLIFYRSDKILEKKEEDVELQRFFENITNLFTVKPDVSIEYPTSGTLKKVNKAALTQIFINLISNALKYNQKEQRRVQIRFDTTPDYYYFEVQDNGEGISRENFSKIFELFTTLDQNDREGNPGSGIGLATVKKLITHMGGEINIESKPGQGSNFKFKIKRSY